MKRWRNHSLLAVFLAVFVTLSLGIAIVNANVMGVEMALAADNSGTTGKSCANCPDDGDGAVACSDACVVTVFATLPVQLTVTVVKLAEHYALLSALPRDGPASNEPYPPKSFATS